MAEIRTDEWLAELERLSRAAPSPDDAWSSEQVAAALGIGNRPALTLLRRLVAAGRVEVVTVRRRDLIGRMGQVKPTG